MKESHLVIEYRRRQLRFSLMEILGVTTVIAGLCAVGRFGLAVAIFFIVSGGTCRVMARTSVAWIAGPIFALLAMFLGALIHPILGLICIVAIPIIVGWHMGRDRFYREVPHWNRMQGDRDG